MEDGNEKAKRDAEFVWKRFDAITQVVNGKAVFYRQGGRWTMAYVAHRGTTAPTQYQVNGYSLYDCVRKLIDGIDSGRWQ